MDTNNNDLDRFDEIILDVSSGKAEKLDALSTEETLALLLYTKNCESISNQIIKKIPSNRLGINDWLQLTQSQEIDIRIAETFKTDGPPDFGLLDTIKTKCTSSSPPTAPQFVIDQKINRQLQKISDWKTIVEIFSNDSYTNLHFPLYTKTIPSLVEKNILNYTTFNFEDLHIFDQIIQSMHFYDFYGKYWIFDLYLCQIQNHNRFWKYYEQISDNIKKKGSRKIVLVKNTNQYIDNYLNNQQFGFFLALFTHLPYSFADNIKMCNLLFDYDENNLLPATSPKSNINISVDTQHYIDELAFENTNGYSSLKLGIYKPVYDYLIAKNNPSLTKAIKETCTNILPIKYK